MASSDNGPDPRATWTRARGISFRVEGVPQRPTWSPSQPDPFDETYEVKGEHPAQALGKLLQEIEWGILDGYRPFTISFPG